MSNRYSNRSHQTNELGKVWSWTYNELNQQTTATDPIDRTTMFAYSLNPNCCGGSSGIGQAPSRIISPTGREAVIDNGVTDTYVANVLNQYTNITMSGGWAGVPSYDGNGNLVAALGTTNTYDAQNRLLSSENVTNRMVFEYDAKNRCVRREVFVHTNATWSFSHAYVLYYDGWNLVEERAPNNTAICHYIHGANTDEILVRIGAADPVYRYENALGSVTALASTTGDVVETYKYDIYGKASVFDASGVVSASTTFQNRFLFTGREWLVDVGLYDYRNRVYSATMGRFFQTDPVRFDAGDLTLYRYVFNMPSIFTDPSGLNPAVAGAALTILGAILELIGIGADLVLDRGCDHGCMTHNSCVMCCILMTLVAVVAKVSAEIIFAVGLIVASTVFSGTPLPGVALALLLGVWHYFEIVESIEKGAACSRRCSAIRHPNY